MEGHSNSPAKIKDDEINYKLTFELQNLPKYERFKKWLEDNGAKYPKIQYPVAFGEHGLIGGSAKDDIPPSFAFLYVPSKMIISEESIKKSPIGKVLSENPNVFSSHVDAEYLSLAIFLLYELMKGEESFWFPYFEIVNESDLLCFWAKEDLEELQDRALVREALQYRKEIESELYIMRLVVSKYPTLFPKEKYTDSQFLKAYKMVITRCFGWSLPCTMMVPFADCLNHAPIDIHYELYNSRFHPSFEKSSYLQKPHLTPEDMDSIKNDTQEVMKALERDHSGYATREKISVDFSDVKPEHGLEKRPVTKNVFIDFEAKKIEQNQNKIMEELKQTDLEIWNYAFYTSSESEDNDTEYESEEEEEDEEEKKEGDQQNEESKNTEAQVKEESHKEVDEKIQNLINISEASDFEIRNMKEESKKVDVFQQADVAEVNSNATTEASKEEEITMSNFHPPISTLPISLKNSNEEEKLDIKKVNEHTPPLIIDKFQVKFHTIKPDLVYKLRHHKNTVDEEEEDFTWYNSLSFCTIVDRWTPEDPDTYFALCTKPGSSYKKNSQVFICYGRRTNRFLLLNYGFTLDNNKYNSVSFKIWMPKVKPETFQGFSLKDIKQNCDYFGDDQAINSEEPIKTTRKIHLKENQLCTNILTYLRAMLIPAYSGKNSTSLLYDEPVEYEFEIHVLASACSIIRDLYTTRFKTSIVDDKKNYQEKKLTIRQKFAYIHRIKAKEIVLANINRFEVLMRILQRMAEGETFKQSYSKIVSNYEDEESAIDNRRAYRKYLRQLYYNRLNLLS